MAVDKSCTRLVLNMIFRHSVNPVAQVWNSLPNTALLYDAFNTLENFLGKFGQVMTCMV